MAAIQFVDDFHTIEPKSQVTKTYELRYQKWKKFQQSRFKEIFLLDMERKVSLLREAYCGIELIRISFHGHLSFETIFLNNN